MDSASKIPSYPNSIGYIYQCHFCDFQMRWDSAVCPRCHGDDSFILVRIGETESDLKAS